MQGNSYNLSLLHEFVNFSYLKIWLLEVSENGQLIYFTAFLVGSSDTQ